MVAIGKQVGARRYRGRAWLRRSVRRVCCLSGPLIQSLPLLIVLMCQISCQSRFSFFAKLSNVFPSQSRS